MLKVTERIDGERVFLFFDDFEEDQFESFVSLVIKLFGNHTMEREWGPYSELVKISCKGVELVLTSGSFEGCFMSLSAKDVNFVRSALRAGD